ncbi:MAG TPA: DNA-processing protein DprA [Opitutaceae bacterium]|nr:DNA-processing protein DprA [Opitutaceae bacterium]
MIESLTANTQVILLLTAPLIAGRGDVSPELLSLGDYNRLARMLRDEKKQPADLIGPDAKALIDACAQVFGRPRIEALLGRGFLMSQAVERWNARAIWVFSRADAKYPKRLKNRLKEEAPPILYGCGDVTLLDRGGLAVVGSRHVDEDLLRYTEKVGRCAAEARRPIVSGAAKGIDQAAMHGALEAGGVVAGVMADSLERAALARDYREALMDGKLVLTCPYDPAAGFNVGHAMQRNKLIYALADAALVVNSDFEKGGTWTGAVEQLDRLHFVPLFVRNGASMPKGNAALLRRGAQPWPNPRSGGELNAAMAAAAGFGSTEPKQDSLPLILREDASGDGVASVDSAANQKDKPAMPPKTEMESAAGEELLTAVRAILQRACVDAKTEEELAGLLAVIKPQAKAWVARLAEEGVLEKVKNSKPSRYRTSTASGRLL